MIPLRHGRRGPESKVAQQEASRQDATPAHVSLRQAVSAIAENSGVDGARPLAAWLFQKADDLRGHPGLEDHNDYKLPESRLFPEILAILDLCGV